MLAAGGIFFLLFVHDGRDDERRLATTIIVAAAVVAALARILAEPVRAIQLTGEGIGAVLDPRAYGVTLRTADGWSGLVRLLGLTVVLFAVVQRGTRRGLVVASLGAVVALASSAMAGHTVTGQPQWLLRTSDFVHVLAAAAWFGGLFLLGLVLRRRWGEPEPIQGARMVARFSGWATIALAVVLVAGIGLAWAEIRTFDALFGSTYGTVLLIKIALVLVVVAVGAYNNRGLVPTISRAADDGPDGAMAAWRRLASTVRAEAAILVVVLAVTGMLVHIAPPRPHEAPANDDHMADDEQTDRSLELPVP